MPNHLKSLKLTSATLILCLVSPLSLAGKTGNLDALAQAPVPAPLPSGTIQRDDDNPDQNRQAQAERLFQAGIEQYRQRQYPAALQKFQQVLVIRREIGDKAGEARTLHKIGSVYFKLNQYQQALDYYQQALPIRRIVGDKAGEAHTLFNIGAVYQRRNQRREARQFFNQALAIYKQIGDRKGESITVSNIQGPVSESSVGARSMLRDDDEIQTSTAPAQQRNQQMGTSSGEGSVLPDDGHDTGW